MKNKLLLFGTLCLVFACSKVEPVEDDPVIPVNPVVDTLDNAALQFWKSDYAGTGFESTDSIARAVYMRNGESSEFNLKLRTAASDNR